MNFFNKIKDNNLLKKIILKHSSICYICKNPILVNEYANVVGSKMKHIYCEEDNE